MVVSFMALILAIPGSSNCASADSCTVASTGSFTGDLGIKSQTNYTLTQAHTFANNVTANWEDSGGNHVGTVIMKDNSGDFNLNGGLRLGTSVTSTAGTLRWNGSVVQVYNSGWVGVGGSPTDDIGQVTSDSGSFTATSQQDNINIVGSGTVSTAIVGDTLTITGATPAASSEFANFSISSDQTLAYAGSSNSTINFDTENLDTENCFSTSSGVITYDSGCSTAYYQVNTMNIINFTGLTDNKAMIQGRLTSNPDTNYRTWVTLFNFPNYTLNINQIVCIDPSDTFYLEFYHGSGYSTGSAIWRGGTDDSTFNLIKLANKGSSC